MIRPSLSQSQVSSDGDGGNDGSGSTGPLSEMLLPTHLLHLKAACSIDTGLKDVLVTGKQDTYTSMISILGNPAKYLCGI